MASSAPRAPPPAEKPLSKVLTPTKAETLVRLQDKWKKQGFAPSSRLPRVDDEAVEEGKHRESEEEEEGKHREREEEEEESAPLPGPWRIQVAGYCKAYLVDKAGKGKLEVVITPTVARDIGEACKWHPIQKFSCLYFDAPNVYLYVHAPKDVEPVIYRQALGKHVSVTVELHPWQYSGMEGVWCKLLRIGIQGEKNPLLVVRSQGNNNAPASWDDFPEAEWSVSSGKEEPKRSHHKRRKPDASEVVEMD